MRACASGTGLCGCVRGEGRREGEGRGGEGRGGRHPLDRGVGDRREETNGEVEGVDAQPIGDNVPPLQHVHPARQGGASERMGNGEWRMMDGDG